MKKTNIQSILIVLAMFIGSNACAQSTPNSDSIANDTSFVNKPDFRNTRWGMSIAEVKKIEKAEFLYADKDGLLYKTMLSRLNCYIFYKFAANKLIAAQYNIIEEHTNKNFYIDDYLKLKNGLQQKYGVPLRDDVIWNNDLYKNDPQEWGMAVAVGYLEYMAAWRIKTGTVIGIHLKGDNFKISNVIIYYSKDCNAPDALDGL